MNVVVSTKTLYKELCKIDFDRHSVHSIYVSNGLMVLYYTAGNMNVIVPIQDNTTYGGILPHEARWDWVKKLCGETEEQPVVLQISEKQVNVIFQY